MAAAPTFTYDPLTDVGKVRLKLNDTDLTKPGASATDYTSRGTWTVFFSDEEITAVLGLQDNNINLSVASCLRTVASSKLLLAKYQRFTLNDVEVDLGRVARDLLDQAESLEELEEDTSAPFIVIGGPDDSIFALDERRWVESLD